MTTDRPLTLNVTDFGPVAKACVSLRPLTVFVGPSNTGKSWLATLAYALHRHFANPPWGWRPWWFDTPSLTEDLRADLGRIAERLTAPTRGSEPATEAIPLTPSVDAVMRRYLERHGEVVGQTVERCFGVDAGARLVRKGTELARVLLRHTVEGASTPAEHEMTLGEGGWAFRPTVPDGFSIRHRDRFGERLDEWLAADYFSERRLGNVDPPPIWTAIIGALTEALLPSRHPAFYLPPDRNGLMNAHRTVVNALIRSATMAGIRGAHAVPPLSGVRGDFLEQLVAMASGQRQRSRSSCLDELGERIEGEILRGSVRIGEVPGVAYPHFVYRPSGWGSDLPLSNTSSMVSELAPVVLYLRHVVAPGDLLIIDEPESHLHPAIQVKFTRQIAQIVRAGVRIIVTTHSEWVLEELGNVVGRGRMTDGDAGNTDASLGAGDVGVWLFEPTAEGGGSTVKEIALDEESGLYPSGFDAVARQLHNDWASLPAPRGNEE